MATAKDPAGFISDTEEQLDLDPELVSNLNLKERYTEDFGERDGQESKQKYIAAGYLEDLTRLQAKFAGMSSFDFRHFKEIWKEENFSLIFKGRPDENELNEFINEIYVITCKFLFVPSQYMNAGAVFVLYTLFRLQPDETRIKIRLELKHFEKIKSLRDLAISNKYKTLHYCIDYLMDNAFVYVHSQRLMGPLTRMEMKKKEVKDDLVSFVNTYKSDFLDYTTNNRLQTLKDLKEQYMDCKTNFVLQNDVTEDVGVKLYDYAFDEMEKIKDPAKYKKADLASKRAKIKAIAFKNKAVGRHGATSDREEEPNIVGKKKKKGGKKRVSMYPRQKRVPKDQRRVGRPRKKGKDTETKTEPSSDENIDISHLLESYPFTEENTRKVRRKRNPYYVDKPDEAQNKSDSDDEAVDAPDSEEDEDSDNEDLSVPVISTE